jgi:hypothetical protein
MDAASPARCLEFFYQTKNLSILVAQDPAQPVKVAAKLAIVCASKVLPPTTSTILGTQRPPTLMRQAGRVKATLTQFWSARHCGAQLGYGLCIMMGDGGMPFLPYRLALLQENFLPWHQKHIKRTACYILLLLGCSMLDGRQYTVSASVKVRVNYAWHPHCKCYFHGTASNRLGQLPIAGSRAVIVDCSWLPRHHA